MTPTPQRGRTRRQFAAHLVQRVQGTSVLILDLAAEVGHSPSSGLGGALSVGRVDRQLHRDTGIDRRRIRKLLSDHNATFRTRKSLPTEELSWVITKYEKGAGTVAQEIEPRRINVAVPPDELAAIKLLIKREGISLTEAVRRLIGYGEAV